MKDTYLRWLKSELQFALERQRGLREEIASLRCSIIQIKYQEQLHKDRDQLAIEQAAASAKSRNG